jgi:hypothetical protein
VSQPSKDILEHAVQRLDHEAQPASRDVPTDPKEGPETRAYSILALLAQELPKLLEGNPSTTNPHYVSSTNNKRRRIDESESVGGAATGIDNAEDRVSSPGLPPPSALDKIIEAYFACIHPWIPTVHQTRFRTRLGDPRERPKLDVVLRAMVLAASRFVRDQNVAISRPDQLRSWVVSTAMGCMSVESLQAMIILCFNDVSLSGHSPGTRVVPAASSLTPKHRSEADRRPGLGLLSVP